MCESTLQTESKSAEKVSRLLLLPVDLIGRRRLATQQTHLYKQPSTNQQTATLAQHLSSRPVKTHETHWRLLCRPALTRRESTRHRRATVAGRRKYRTATCFRRWRSLVYGTMWKSSQRWLYMQVSDGLLLKEILFFSDGWAWLEKETWEGNYTAVYCKSELESSGRQVQRISVAIIVMSGFWLGSVSVQDAGLRIKLWHYLNSWPHRSKKYTSPYFLDGSPAAYNLPTRSDCIEVQNMSTS